MLTASELVSSLPRFHARWSAGMEEVEPENIELVQRRGGERGERERQGRRGIGRGKEVWMTTKGA